jgi:hypothetical protein
VNEVEGDKCEAKLGRAGLGGRWEEWGQSGAHLRLQFNLAQLLLCGWAAADKPTARARAARRQASGCRRIDLVISLLEAAPSRPLNGVKSCY